MKPRTLLQGLAGLAAWGCLSGLALVRLWAVLYGCVPGPAILAAAAALDAVHFSEIVGCIAGDDTIMCAVRSVDETIVLMDKLNKIIYPD